MLVRSLQWLLTFNLICFAWVFFRARTLENAFDVLGQLFTLGGSAALITPLVIVTILAMLASQFVPPSVPRRAEVLFARLAPVLQIGCRRHRPRARERARSRGHRPLHLLPVLIVHDP